MSPASAASRTLVLDNGAHTIKAGYALPGETAGYTDCALIPNCISRSRDRRVYVGPEVSECKDFGSMVFRRPVERGYLVNWESEKEVWDRVFFGKGGGVGGGGGKGGGEGGKAGYLSGGSAGVQFDASETNLIVTEAPNAPAALGQNVDQIVFEEYEFQGLYRCVGAGLVPFSRGVTGAGGGGTGGGGTIPPECTLVIDSGHSFTHIIPVIRGKVYNPAVRRIDVGGKFLTGWLKEVVSIRHYNMMDEGWVVERVKEETCFVAADFRAEMERWGEWKRGGGGKGRGGKAGVGDGVVLEYVLPDWNVGRRGGVRGAGGRTTLEDGEGAQHMTLSNERFMIPEAVFTPSDVGLRQAGVCEAVMQALEKVPGVELRYALLANVVLVGGNVMLKGFKERFEAELRPLAPVDADVRVTVPDDPIKHIWRSGVDLANNTPEFEARLITREEYLEHGTSWVAKRFMGLPLPPGGDGGGGASGEKAGESTGGGGGGAGGSHKRRRVEES